MLIELKNSRKLYHRIIQKHEEEIQRERYISQKKPRENHWWPKINIMTIYSNGILKNNKLVRQYKKWTIWL